MKMKLYYVVREGKGRYGENNVDYVAGPFTFDGAWAYRDNLEQHYNYSIVDQTIDVDY